MYGYNILYTKKINIYTHYTLLITRVKPTLTLITAKRHPRCALLITRVKPTLTLITAKRHSRCALLITRVKPTLTLITR